MIITQKSNLLFNLFCILEDMGYKIKDLNNLTNSDIENLFDCLNRENKKWKKIDFFQSIGMLVGCFTILSFVLAPCVPENIMIILYIVGFLLAIICIVIGTLLEKFLRPSIKYCSDEFLQELKTFAIENLEEINDIVKIYQSKKEKDIFDIDKVYNDYIKKKRKYTRYILPRKTKK